MADKSIVPKFVIGLGASAGGLDALEQFFDHAPVDSGAAFIVVMHLSRDFKSMLDELLARHTGMAVKPAIAGAKIEANTVYVIQPDTSLEVGTELLKVEKRQTVGAEGVAVAVDVMLQSLAANWGVRSASVILSGSGSDGAKGTQAVREAGGFTCAQSPETAKFDSMPIASISTDAVNAVEAPDQLAHTVVEGLELPLLSRTSPIPTEHEQAMSLIVDSVVGSSTIKAREYKHSTFERRISRRMMALRINDLTEYAQLVHDDSKEAQTLSQELLIGVTDFFRDDKPFKVIQNQIVAQIIKNAHEEKRSVRIWIAGCATGEEVYSIAILFREALRDMPFEIDVQIFATDISKKHLAEATRGIYSEERVSNIPKTLLKRYFELDEDTKDWTVIKRVRNMVVFAPHDLLSDPPFTKLDLVCCRNVLIYFSVEAQQRILGGFAFGLRHGGFLFLGSSETVGGQREAFEFVDARNRIFQRSQRHAPPRSMSRARELYPASVPLLSTARKNTRIRGAELQPAYAALLAQFAPASLLISDERDLLHTFGNASRFLRAPQGVANLDVTELIDPALKAPLIAALERANKGKGALTFSKIATESVPEAGLLVDLTVQRLEPKDENASSQFLAIVDDHKSHDQQGDSIPVIDADELISNRNADLEDELARTREALQSTIEEIETANEELQASNEELMSANEELQSTNEELSSVNEELYSVNAEYHRQNDDLSRLTNDFDLLLNATQIGVMFLDDESKITRFTGLAKTLFGLEDSDIGRPMSTFNSPFTDFDFAESMRSLPTYGSVSEQECTDNSGKPWIIRMVRDDANFGVVVAFIDIEDLRGAEAELRTTHQMLKGLRSATNDFILEVGPQFKTVYNQVGFADFVGIEGFELPHTLAFDNVHPDDLDRLKEYFAAAQESNPDDFFCRMYSKRDDDYRHLRASVTKLENGNWQIVATDVEEISQLIRQASGEQAIAKASILSGSSYRVFVDHLGICGLANSHFATLVGKEQEEIDGKALATVLPSGLYASVLDGFEAAVNGQASEVVAEVTITDAPVLFSINLIPVIRESETIGVIFDGVNVAEVADYAEKFSTNDRLITAATRNSNRPVAIVERANGNVIFANYAAQTMLGLSSNEFEVGKFNISRLTPECGEASWTEFLKQVADKGEFIINDQLVLDRAKLPMKADIHIEADLVDAQSHVAIVRVIENPDKVRTIEDLKERSRKLTSSNRDLEQFTSAVAHDLRAPLRHITSFSDMLETKADALTPEEVNEHAGIIAGSARNLSNMVAALLDYARIGLREKPMERCDLEKVLATARLNLSEEIAASDAIVVVSGKGHMKGNFELLVSLFQNLISNSIKYRKPDVPPEITIEIVKSDDDGATVSIADNGIGIDADFSRKIFQIFRRLHSEDEYSGLGIGLTICRKIAELHSTEISLDTDYTGGSRFVLEPLG